MELHALSNGSMSMKEFVDKAIEIYPYVDYIHVREKQRTARELVYWIETLLENGVPADRLVINDRVDVAYVTGIGGVHLGETGLSPAVVPAFFKGLRAGKSVHSPRGAMDAEREGADYLFFGHVFHSTSKEGVSPRGLETFQIINEMVDIPVIAIGGITPDNIAQVMRKGAAGAAAMSFLWDSEDAKEAAKQLREGWFS
ncbi:thiamine phosphate synthase [Pontibacillus salicampi]|uniref:Thiamine phosphate synthase n=1 Tax=Pontibacillus salicampi TaxID=1449801 RepID=A0ABV6LPR9_9BACI